MCLNERANESDRLNRNAKSHFANAPHAHSTRETDQGSITQTRCYATDPVIVRFRAALTNIQTSELSRLYRRLPHLDDHSRQAIRQFADDMVAKMLNPPLESLRTETGNGPREYLLDALQRLFRLDVKRSESSTNSLGTGPDLIF